MTQYTLEINYIGNSEKSAKLILININNKTEEFIGHAILPRFLHKEKEFKISSIIEKKYVNEEYLSAYKKKSLVSSVYLDLFGNSYISEGKKDISNYIKKMSQM